MNASRPGSGTGDNAGDDRLDDPAPLAAVTADEVYTLYRGSTPLLISVPHVGLHIPPEMAATMQPRALQVEDADRHLDRLYAFARDLGAGLLVPRHARYVIDLNRPSEDTPMYPGQNGTGLLPRQFFTGDPLYLPGQEPGAAEVQRRVERYWRPYHDARDGELTRLRAAHGHALLWEGHSIQAELPWLFDGRLPELNLGTVDGRSCAPGLRAALQRVLAGQQTHSFVVDGRFKGGHITRHYGRPDAGIHAVQMEMAWHCCMAPTAPWAWDEDAARRVQPVLRALLQAMLDWRPDGG
jgi:N-formylglutamate deformylase